MKVGDAPKSSRPARTETGKTIGARDAASDASPVSPGDRLDLLGVPESELTPLVRRALAALMEEMQKLRAELAQARKALADLETLADRDALLDIFNRRAFARELERALAMMDRYDMRASLVFIDLNDLKKINDARGHAAGDAALAHIAQCLQANVRQTDAVGRLGGDEFGVLLMQTDKATAERKAAELAALIAEAPVRFKDQSFPARISWGAVELRRGRSAREAMEHADDAMYAAKRVK